VVRALRRRLEAEEVGGEVEDVDGLGLQEGEEVGRLYLSLLYFSIAGGIRCRLIQSAQDWSSHARDGPQSVYLPGPVRLNCRYTNTSITPFLCGTGSIVVAHSILVRYR